MSLAHPRFSASPPAALGTLHRLLEEQGRRWPGRAAILDARRAPLDFAGLAERARYLRESLAARGIGPGDRVALVVGNGALGHTTVLAAASGSACAPLRHDSSERELDDLLARLSPRALLVEHGLESRARVVARRRGVPVMELRAPSEAAAGTFLLEGQESPPPSAGAREPGPEELALILPTSGSTGAPRLVPLTQAGLAAIAWGTSQALELTVEDRSLCFMDPFHVHGLVSCVLAPLVSGGSVACVGPLDVGRFSEWLRELQPTWYSTSPPLHRILLEEVRRSPLAVAGHALRFVRSGAAPLAKKVQLDIEEALGVPLIEAYGMTEIPNVAGNPVAARRVGSVGRSAGAQIAVLDEGGSPLPRGELGEIAVRGPGLTPGYLDDPDDWGARQRRGWFLTGDIGFLDGDGYLYLRGRREERINRGGNKVMHREVDEALEEIPGVARALSFSFPHRILGEDLAAAIVESSPGGLVEAELLRALRQRLSAYKVPTRILILPELPTSPTGKPLRRLLAGSYGARLAAEAEALQAGPAETPAERWVASLWKEVLGAPEVGRHEDFFALGGTSIHVVRLANRLEEALGIALHVPLFFELRTVGGFCRWLEDQHPDALARALDAPDDVRPRHAPFVPARGLERFRKLLAERPWEPLRPPEGRNPRAVFVLSAPRSGSTLLRVMLAGHPRLFAPPELRLLHYESLRGWWEHHQGPRAFWREGAIQARMQLDELPFEEAEGLLRQAAEAGQGAQAWLANLQRGLGDRVLVDKSPQYALDPRALARMEEWFDRPLYIHLTRHPAACVHSWVRSGMDQLWEGPQPFAPERLAELIWAECQRNLLAHQGLVPGERWHRVCFEELVEDPDGVMTGLARFLGIEDRAELRRPYEDPARRMSRPARPGSRALGDPRFHLHESVDPVATRDWVGEFDLASLDGNTWRLAEDLGYRSGRQTASWDPLIAVVGAWTGRRPRAGSLLVGRNLAGSRRPLFWCLQSEAELDALAGQLGDDQPVWGLRSAHGVLPRDRLNLDALARHYSRELLEVHPAGVYALGGNCQGGRLAFGIALELMRLGRAVAPLVLMEAIVERPFPGHVALLFGERSEFHPARLGLDPEELVRGHYQSVAWETIPGGHGEYFQSPNVEALAAVLRRHLAG